MFFSIFNPFLVVIGSCLAVLTARLLLNKNKFLILDERRNPSIDGLRGFLAIFVFYHHSNIWYSYIHTHKWVAPSSHFYTNIGQVGVIFFFMITGYLFTGKIKKNKSLNWPALFRGRLFRLTPLYLFTIMLLVIMVFITSDWKIHTSLTDVFKSILYWIPFTWYGMPDINNLERTRSIVASVPWTLVYEWYFYFCLPILALILGRRTSPFLLIISFYFLADFFLAPYYKIQTLAFLCGICTSLIDGNAFIRKVAAAKTGSLLCVAVLMIILFTFEMSYNAIPIMGCGLVFVLLANGCSIYGMLHQKYVRYFGEATYSVYLLHGPLLYFMINILLGKTFVASLSTGQFGVFILILTPILVLISILSFKYIELPFINISSRLNKK